MLPGNEIAMQRASQMSVPSIVDRRQLLRFGAASLVASYANMLSHPRPEPNRLEQQCESVFPPRNVHSIIPVVGDGKWIWTAPPKEERGYLEPRDFDVTVTITLTGQGDATNLIATTVAPVESAEQTIIESDVEAIGCRAGVRKLGEHANQLMLLAPGIRRGQVVSATAKYRLRLHKDYRGLEASQFPAEQQVDRQVLREYGTDSPGIEVRSANVRRLAREITAQIEHPWDQAKAFYEWVRENINPRLQSYTSVNRALRDRVGDCEECAAVFVALCRSVGIPARLVWVPGHNWAEFCLLDVDSQPIWIPAHTAAYPWFGWTGVHEVVLQKGDRIHFPEKRRDYRLLIDWMQWLGRKPQAHFTAEIHPVRSSGQDDAGPGARRKRVDGRWEAIGEYADAKFVRKS